MKKKKTQRKHHHYGRMMHWLPLKGYSLPKDEQPVCKEHSRNKEAVIFKSELDYISRCILDYPSIETGGQLFGFYTEFGVPVVLYAIGPGRNANHQVAFFNQDIEYLTRIGAELTNYFGLHHIGEWHSHHQLGLARPSGHDASTMVNTIQEKNLGKFLLCIGNCDGKSTTLNPFPCDSEGYCSTQWDVIFADSPLRRPIDRLLTEDLVMPRTPEAHHRDPRLNSASSTRPVYKPGYWLAEKANNLVLKEILAYIQEQNGKGVATAIKLDSEDLVHIHSEGVNFYGKKWSEDIIFPIDFPEKAPLVKRWIDKEIVPMTPREWSYSGNILKSFIHYYSNL